MPGSKPQVGPTIPRPPAVRASRGSTGRLDRRTLPLTDRSGRTQEVAVARTAHSLPPVRTAVADLDHAAATGAVLLGLVALVLVVADASRAGVVCGLVGMALALAAQMWSRTRAERFVDMAALLTCFTAVAVGIRDGGGF